MLHIDLPNAPPVPDEPDAPPMSDALRELAALPQVDALIVGAFLNVTMAEAARLLAMHERGGQVERCGEGWWRVVAAHP